MSADKDAGDAGAERRDSPPASRSKIPHFAPLHSVRAEVDRYRVSSSFFPSSAEDIFLPATWQKIVAWRAAVGKEWSRCAQGKLSRFHTPTMIIHQIELHPEARGYIWDLRPASGPVPVNSSHLLRPPILNANRIRDWMLQSGYPDVALCEDD